MKKSVIAVTAAMFLTAVSFSATPDVTKITEGLNAFSTTLLDTVPNTATQQGVWSDAWIGNLIPSVPPHFGGGISAGFAQLDMTGLAQAANELGISISSDKLFLPTVTADVRIGGIFLPFDLGLSFMKIPAVSLEAFGAGITVDFFTIGGSVRFPVLKGNVILPKVSVGAGFMYTTGSIQASASDNAVYTSVAFNTKTVYAEAQISKTFFIITPFFGVRGILSDSKNDWAWKYNASFGGYTIGDEEKGSVTRKFSDDFLDNFQAQAYAGLSLNIFIIQTTVGASYNFGSNIWGGNLSLRIKL
ncbi:hypothetical protein [Treponema brennaborense]|uniref:Lipoprotein n=1 Tax=Treponema brennaborense (strain DSM 12168 / CIP 105900 / DD5/3) TaxID=906968 RepID=F4LKY0_TREBD|nr:hypothetical protein [Treponema brennaborense]AEE16577.1 hypothetical protein Trebr_1149 [Treponema brennaborense DSM 12168]